MSEAAKRFFEAERLRAAGDPRAEAEYIALLGESPRHLGGLEGLASVHEAAGRADEAAACRTQADAVRAEGTANVAATLLYHGDTARARGCCERALELDPDCVKAHWLLGDICAREEDRSGALVHYRRCREIAPDRLGPAFLMAALGDAPAPDRAPADYVTAQFDWYADSFDTHLMETLLYRGPEEVARALRPDLEGKAPTILDLGCGTGLLAPELRGAASRLVGVDLSPAMLKKAAEYGAYDALEQVDIEKFLAAQPAESADIAAAVDVVVYIGALDTLFAAVFRVLRPGGAFAFTTERWNDDDAKDPAEEPGWRLHRAGRYRHARFYLCRLADATGFAVETLEDRVLRYELGLPVDSDLVLLRKPK